MKASNKTLLILFVVVFGYILLSHFVLHAKWKNGKFDDQSGFSLYVAHALPAFKYLKLVGLSDCRLIPALQGKLDIEKNLFDLVKYHMEGDTLVVDGSISHEGRVNFGSGQSPQTVKIYLPPVEQIEAVNSRLDLKGEPDLKNARKMNFYLDRSSLNTRTHFELDSIPRFYDSLSVKANRSEVFLFRKDHFNNINLDMVQSSFYEKNAKRESISIRADSNSMVVKGGGDFQYLITR